jgi:hypothetical protein
VWFDAKLGHLRSSRLSGQWRVRYGVEADVVTVYVERLSPHDAVLLWPNGWDVEARRKKSA